MKSYDLSIVIPARNEEFLSLTVADLVKNKRGKTEVIVILDGQWAEPPIEDHPDVRIIYVPESIGQRAAQNLGLKLSNAKYVAKTDAHVAFDEGFDVKLMEKMEDDITMVPVMRNLHIFNWRCKNCGMETYQGAMPTECRNEICEKAEDGGEGHRGLGFEKHIVWNPKDNPQSSAYRFNSNLRFKYFPELRNKQQKTGLQETMSLQGSFFMCTREKYWSLKLCDESLGSWGMQGSEVAIKTWLSGGRVLCNMDTWYAHLFRTQTGFSFPYPQSGKGQQKAIELVNDLFKNNAWEHQKYSLSWLIKKFWFALKDVSDTEAKWTEEDLNKYEFKDKPSKGIIYYTTNKLNLKIAHKVQKQLLKAGLPIVSTSLKPMTFGSNFVVQGEPSVETYYKQIITALEKSTADIVFFCEHDVLYSPTHFDYTVEKGKFAFNLNVWRWKYPENHFVTWEAQQVGAMSAWRLEALEWYRNKIKNIDRSYEPQENTVNYKSEIPNIDIRHGENLTKSKWSINDFRDKSTCINWKEANRVEGWVL